MAVVAAAAALCASVVSLGTVGATTVHKAHEATVHSDKFTVVKTAKFGEVLAAGDTVYTLKPSSRACTAAKCFKFWPPVVLPKGVTHPIAGSGVTASKLGAKSVKGVGLQVTYDGHLLYWYYKDTAPGQVNGDVTDTWGKWTPVVLSKSSSTPTTTPTTTPGTGGVSF